MSQNRGSLPEWIKCIATSIIVPIAVGSITTYISFKINKPTEYVIRESFNMNEFEVSKYFLYM